jgi:hypothetical protein
VSKLIGVHTLYKYIIWSKNGMSIIEVRYVMIYASESSVKNIICSNGPDSIEKFFEILRCLDIKIEKIDPISLDSIRYMRAE